LPAPALSSSAPNSTNRNTKLVETPSAMPNTPWVVIHWWLTSPSELLPTVGDDARHVGAAKV
jgi:hypothetical protein